MLVGLCREDTDEDIEYGVRKILNLRIFDNPENQKRWDKSVVDRQLEILCVSQVGCSEVLRFVWSFQFQFTLHTVLKGNKPDFHRSMGPDQAPSFYAKFMENLRAAYVPEKIKAGFLPFKFFIHI